MKIYTPLRFFSPPLCFPFPPPPSKPPPPRPIVLNTSSPSLVDYMTEPRLPSLFLLSPGVRGRNDKSYLQVTVGNSEIQDVEKFKLLFFFCFYFFLSFYPVLFDGRATCDAARWTAAQCGAVLSDNLREDWSAFRDFDYAGVWKWKQDISPSWHVLKGSDTTPHHISNTFKPFRSASEVFKRARRAARGTRRVLVLITSPSACGPCQGAAARLVEIQLWGTLGFIKTQQRLLCKCHWKHWLSWQR